MIFISPQSHVLRGAGSFLPLVRKILNIFRDFARKVWPTSGGQPPPSPMLLRPPIRFRKCRARSPSGA
jgi:hypothetical protein